MYIETEVGPSAWLVRIDLGERPRSRRVAYQRGRGFSLKGMSQQEDPARELRDRYGHTELQIEATLSPFGRAGGFDD